MKNKEKLLNTWAKKIADHEADLLREGITTDEKLAAQRGIQAVVTLAMKSNLMFDLEEKLLKHLTK